MSSRKVDLPERGRRPDDSTLGIDSIASEGFIGLVGDRSPPHQGPQLSNVHDIGDVQVDESLSPGRVASTSCSAKDLLLRFGASKSTGRPSSLPPGDSPSQRRIPQDDERNMPCARSAEEIALASSMFAENSGGKESVRSKEMADDGSIQSIDGRSLSTSPGKATSSPARDEVGDTPLAPRQLEKGQQPSFADMLAAVTMRSPEKLAEKLVDRLQQACEEEAASCRACAVFDAPLPVSRRFSDAVAREFAAKLKHLGFLRFEWWSGKDWREMPGRYIILHDTNYDKYNMRVRVHWPEGLTVKDTAETEVLLTQGRPENAPLDDSALQTLVQQLQQVLAMQTELVLRSVVARESAESRAERAEARALAAENLCLDAVGVAGQGSDVRRPILTRSSIGEYHSRRRSCFAGCLEAFGTRPSSGGGCPESRHNASTPIQSGAPAPMQAKEESELDCAANRHQVEKL